MIDKTLSTFDIPTTAPEGFEHEPDATRDFWHHQPLNTLPPYDFIAPYARHKTLPTPRSKKIATRGLLVEALAVLRRRFI